jgi:tetratricopeptide (TPR) repeat protein
MQALFEILCVTALRSTAIAISASVALWALRIKSPHVLHRAWTMVLVVFLLLPLLSIWAPKIRVPLLPQRTARILKVDEPQRELNLFRKRTEPVSMEGTVVFAEAWSATRKAPQSSADTYRPDLLVIAMALYCLVVCALLFRLFLGSMLGTRMIRRAEREGQLHYSVQCKSPLSLGFFRPQILLPVESKKWAPEKLAAVISHEQAHLRRRDPIIGWLAMLHRCIYWFNPLSWWLCSKLSALAEQACDETVLEQGHDPSQYARLLLELARTVNGRGTLVSAWSSSIGGNILAVRIRGILTSGQSTKMSSFRIAGLLVLCSIAILFPALVTLTRAQAPNRLEQIVPPASIGVTVSTSNDKTGNPDRISLPTELLLKAGEASQGRSSNQQNHRDAALKVISIHRSQLQASTNAEDAKRVLLEKSREILAPISGHIQDSAGRPIPNVKVTVIDRKTKDILSTAISDQKGNFEISAGISTKEISLQFQKDGYHDYQFIGDDPNSGSLKVVLDTMAEWNCRVAEFYFSRGNYIGALGRYQEASSLQPDLKAAVDGIGRSFEIIGEYEKAVMVYRDFIARFPDSSAIPEFKSRILEIITRKR